MSRWKTFRYGLEEAACRLLAWCIPLLSRRACVRVADGLGALAFALDRRGRAVAASNLECVFGERYSAAQRREIARASYQNFVRTMMDLFWASRLTPENYRDWIRVENFEAAIEAFQKSGRSGPVLLCGHQGNWEWSNLAAGFNGFRQVSVAENFKNPRLTAIFNALRERSGATLIPQENSLVRMLKTVKRGGATALVIDLNLPPSQATTVIEAFRGSGPNGEGLKMCVPILHAVLAQRVGASLVLGETRPESDGGCRIIVNPAIPVEPGDSLNAIAQRCWDVLEDMIHRRPEVYLWAYKHFRYKPKKAGRPYPFYANENGKFEKLLRRMAEQESGA